MIFQEWKLYKNITKKLNFKGKYYFNFLWPKFKFADRWMHCLYKTAENVNQSYNMNMFFDANLLIQQIILDSALFLHWKSEKFSKVELFARMMPES